MGRLVSKPPDRQTVVQVTGLDDIFMPEIAANPVPKTGPGDSYLERMLKYIPAETIAFSMVINAIFDQAVKTSGKDALMAGFPVTAIAWAALLVGLILTPLLCWYLHRDGDAWIVNAIVSTVAFPFWAYLMNAVEFADFHDGDLAAILVLTFTMVSGLVTPSSFQPQYHETQTTSEDRPHLLPTGTNLRERVTDLVAAARGRDV